jgi:hypothetical protein
VRQEVKMMPVIRIPGLTFKRLQAIAVPFEDTPARVIDRLLNLYDDYEGATKGSAVASVSQPPAQTSLSVQVSPGTRGRAFPPDSPPDLGHTRVLSANFGGQKSENWNDLVVVAHRVAIKQLKSVDAVRSASLSNVVSGRREDSGFHYSAEGNFSIQNVDANVAWRNVLHLAHHLRLPVEVMFQWRHKQGASNPGVTGTLAWRPE